MKKFAYLFAVIGIACMFTACSNDDDPTMPGASIPAKTYTAADGLTLKLDGTEAAGQIVSFTPSNDGKATLSIKGAPLDISSIIGGMIGGSKADQTPSLELPTSSVIPGSAEVTIPVELTGDASSCSFAGSTETTYCTFAYEGKVSEGALDLSLSDIKLKNTSIAGTYDLMSDSPARVVWDGSEFDLMGSDYNLRDLILLMTTMYPMIELDGNKYNVMAALAAVLKSVTFGEDGSVTAVYADTKTPGLPEVTAPKGLARYVIDGNNTIRLFLSPEAIIAAQASKADDNTNEESEAFDPSVILGKINIEGLISKVVPMLSAGIPLHYGDVVNDAVEPDPKAVSFYLGKETILPILQDVAPVFEDAELRAQLIEFAASQAGDMAPLAKMFLTPALEAFPNIVNNTTTEVQFGLNLKKQ
ncbi:DUF4925 domain-containing protein [uncultured Duncaniella sp.]|uniref:DUF4925 domain-containing protein n=1 Tax=uncultured Duncaniella sp. TaxID=2768039 RepID=UPI00266EE184|nr:DUF4925 domain-containing protein [uncultured Duncaniella sp.]